jgi:hypothetical protein
VKIESVGVTGTVNLPKNRKGWKLREEVLRKGLEMVDLISYGGGFFDRRIAVSKVF